MTRDAAADAHRWLDQSEHDLATARQHPDALPGGTPADAYTTAQGADACRLAAEVLAAVGERLPQR